MDNTQKTDWEDVARPINQESDGALGWDVTISTDPDEIILLEPGEYDFVVAGFSRGRYEGGDKIGPCNTMLLDIAVKSPKGTVTIKNMILMHSKVEFRISQFFTSIGQKKPGEPLQPRWNEIVGSTGKCEISHRFYNGNTYNDIKRFLSPQAPQSPTEFTPGTF